MQGQRLRAIDICAGICRGRDSGPVTYAREYAGEETLWPVTHAREYAGAETLGPHT